MKSKTTEHAEKLKLKYLPNDQIITMQTRLKRFHQQKITKMNRFQLGLIQQYIPGMRKLNCFSFFSIGTKLNSFVVQLLCSITD